MYICVCICEGKCPQSSEWGLDPLELEFQLIVKHLIWVLGTELRSCTRAVGHTTRSSLPSISLAPSSFMTYSQTIQVSSVWVAGTVQGSRTQNKSWFHFSRASIWDRHMKWLLSFILSVWRTLSWLLQPHMSRLLLRKSSTKTSSMRAWAYAHTRMRIHPHTYPTAHPLSANELI